MLTNLYLTSTLNKPKLTLTEIIFLMIPSEYGLRAEINLEA